jgi:uncharacterized protein YabN with tetrapyrrole methylase and pyrophosphatase domain
MASLTVVGLGPARPENMTLEAVTALRQAAQRRDHVYGLAHARDMAIQVVPGLAVKPLDYLYSLPGVDRPTAYRDLAGMLVRKAFTDGLDVVYLVAGSPLFYNDAVLLLRRICAQGGHPLSLVHGLSFVELVLGRVHWTGHHGLQLYSAWNVAEDGIRLSPGSSALLCQLGEFSIGSDALDSDGSVKMLSRLRDSLLGDFPQEHPVTILYSSGPPDYRSLSSRLPLGSLADRSVPVYSNLFIPSLDDPAEGEEAP